MDKIEAKTNPKVASVRWEILRQALLRRPCAQNSDEKSSIATVRISRKTSLGFKLIPSQLVDKDPNFRDNRICYTLPVDGSPKLFLSQRINGGADLSDFEISNRYNVDNTGLVCHWPSEDVLAYFCLSHATLFRSKRVIELGAGYGLAGLVIAATSEASEVVISDGNPQVVDYIQRNIEANSGVFGHTKVKSMTLHWDQEEASDISNACDVIVASDCTFFEEFHCSLAHMIKHLMRNDGNSEAIFFSPKRGDSLNKFLDKIEENGLHFSIVENYNKEIWMRHQQFMNGDNSWPTYEKDHCYPLLVTITL